MPDLSPQPPAPAPATAPAPGAAAGSADRPLCVDLDGCLIRTDALHESVLLLARHRPLDLFRLPFWLARGKAHLKERIARQATPDATLLPYCEPLLEFLRAEQARGRVLVLATASNRRIADAVAGHLGIFSGVVASDHERNLSGRGKLAALEEKFGKGGFDYVGNSKADLPLWAACATPYVCNASPRLLARVSAIRAPAQVFPRAGGTGRALAKAVRPLQWAKNALLVVPLVLAHRVGDPVRLLALAAALVAFCLCASAVYIVNDLLDIEADRAHPRKRLRPFASGRLSIPRGLALLGGLLLGALGAALLADAHRADAAAIPGPAGSLSFSPQSGWPAFTLLLGLYFAMSTAYSLYLKRKLLIDVVVLAGLYTHRIIAGSAAAAVPLTEWLMAFSMFLFLSLAFAKRYGELVIAREREQDQLKGRNYRVEDLHIIQAVGPACAYMAVLVMGLYLSTDAVRRLYQHPVLLWLACPVLLYWVTRLWFLANRRELSDDPLVFAMTDRVSWMAGAVMVLLVTAASV